MTPSSKKWTWDPRTQSSSSSHCVDSAASMECEKAVQSSMEVEDCEMALSLVDRERNAVGEVVVCPSRGGVQRIDKLSRASEDVMQIQSSNAKHATTWQPTESLEDYDLTESRGEDAGHPVYSPLSTSGMMSELVEYSCHDYREGEMYEEEVSVVPHERENPKRSDAAHANTATSSASPAIEFNKRYETLSREYEALRGEHRAKLQLLGKREDQISSLKTDITDVQRRFEEQSVALASVRQKYGSCQAQLDNVQRFISTADAHSDQDVTQQLQKLNEEVYQTSMAMADYLTESFVRQSATTRRTAKARTSVGESVRGAIGRVMLNHLAVVEGIEDAALFLQIAFQGYLSHVLHHIVSSWTVDQRLNALIEETYQRLRKAESGTERQAISGHWRALTRTHILPTHVSDPKVLVEYTMTRLSDIIVATGLVLPRSDAVSKLWSEFSRKISSIVLHAGTFGNMVSEMISGDFEVFTIQPGATFDQESMVDMDQEQGALRGTELGLAQTVLCMTRVGLKKQVGAKTIVLTKAQVVLESLLG
ncbi:hypothetical protein L210DRAFT_3633839 [Boletus edulis BED1]|uniref:Uncharacterized protein n=1 Tax=Boletus edulis BED1 TaxID=1328754 RepID=A0AAD4BIE3_BOLED|nr:hypothetical protein L210DRAFT_3633839 [Boletus edulis BED1]